jgi:3-hydroxybutyryl-CoA dehydrogenase
MNGTAGKADITGAGAASGGIAGAGAICVGIAGAGAMGAGIAQVAAMAGHEVRLYDARPEAAQAAVTAIRATLAQLAQKGKIPADAASAAGARLQPAPAIGHFAGCGLVIEAIVEELAPKQQLLRAVEAVVGPECLLATNTSSLSLAALAAGLRAPRRLAGMHFFNPAPRMELVEIVAGVATDPAVAAALEALARAWGKTPVRARATPGFIVNRAARPFYGEGLRLIAEQAAAPATLDALLRDAGGFRMGPCELTDLIGQDVNFAVTRTVWEALFHDPRFTPSLVQQELVEAGWLGRKTGRGFYDYSPGAAAPEAALEPPAPAPARIAVTGEDAWSEALARRLERGGIKVARHPHLPAEAVLHVSDGRTAAELEAAGERPQPTVVVDVALDYVTATRIAAAASPHCGESAWAEAVGALQAAGFAVTRLPDLPGLAVLRTLAMIINEAADAVHYGVASRADVDLAMRKGVNYPLGPFAWAERLGAARVRTAMAALAAFYGEDRYRPSPGLRRI